MSKIIRIRRNAFEDVSKIWHEKDLQLYLGPVIVNGFSTGSCGQDCRIRPRHLSAAKI